MQPVTNGLTSDGYLLFFVAIARCVLRTCSVNHGSISSSPPHVVMKPDM